MPSRKDRLYVALYARGGKANMPGLEDTYVRMRRQPFPTDSRILIKNSYHWALIVGPKVEKDTSQGFRFHAKESLSFENGIQNSVWSFEERSTSMTQTSMVLVRVLFGKIENTERLKAILRSVPMRGDRLGWNCIGWIEEALEVLQRDGQVLGTSITSWTPIRDAAMQYVDRKKKEHRFDGNGLKSSRVATWDLLEGKETIP